MNKDGLITKSIWSVNNLTKTEYKDVVHFIHYDDFCDSPKNEMDKIYKFLNLKKYSHNFNNIKQYEVNGISYDDTVLGVNIHEVKKCVKKTNHIVEDVLPASIIKRYEDLNFKYLNRH